MGGQTIEINKMATAGSMESNDILIMLSPGDGQIDIEVESIVEQQYGEDIKRVIYDTLLDSGVNNARVVARDKGALDFTIKARVKACVGRGSGDADEL